MRLSVFALALLAAPPLISAPVVQPGDCAVLVGAGSAPESFTSDAEVRQPCTGTAHSFAGAGHAIRAWMDMEPVRSRECQTVGWVANRFQVGGDGVLEARIAMEGWYIGVLEDNSEGHDAARRNAIRVRAQLADVDGSRVVAERDVFAASPLARTRFDARFGVELPARLSAGHEYDVRLLVETQITQPGDPSGRLRLDFGRDDNGSVGYDRIEVCVTKPEDLSDIRAALDGIADDVDGLQDGVDAIDVELDGISSDLDALNAKEDEELALLRAQARKDIEWKLDQKDCLPSLWQPAAEGGQAEEARALVADLIAASRASGETGANVRLAEQKVRDADEAFADGQYQRSCKLLSDSLRALTLP